MTSGRRALRAFCTAAALFAAGTQTALAQTLGQGLDDDISLWRVAGSLLLCAGLAVAGAFVLRARQGHAPLLPFAIARRRRLQLIETLRLGQNIGLSIVSCDGREILVLVSPEGSKVLEEFPARSLASAMSEERA
jgi:flagellar biogenesis protein FliO